MKTLNKKIFLRHPVALAAAIVAASGKESSGYESAAERVINYFNFLEIDSVAEISGSPFYELASEGEIRMIQEFAHRFLGDIYSFTNQRLSDEINVFHSDTSTGYYKMILVVESEKIKAMQLTREEMTDVMRKAA